MSARTELRVLDLFAGPGGWSEGLRRLGVREVGIEIDPAVCATRVAAGHTTIRADVAAYPTAPLVGRSTGVVGSAPCQPFSAAGLRAGTDDLPLCHQGLDDLAGGTDTRAALRTACSDPRSLLVIEPLRYALAPRPEWIALEEVPAVLGLFEHTARLLASVGYSTWTGILNAVDYGLAQTRRRAILLASRTRPALPPEPTHTDGGAPVDLFGDSLPPWRTMREVLGCPPGIVITRGNHTSGGSRFPTTGPSWALTGRARSWLLKVGNRPGATRRRLDQPAPTLLFGTALNDVAWIDNDGTPMRQLYVPEAAILQGFTAHYPWAGSRTKQFQQIGNAVPPPLAAHILTPLITNSRREVAA